MMFDEVYEKLAKISKSVLYDSFDYRINLSEQGISAYIDENDKPCAELKFEEKIYRYTFSDCEKLYDFLHGVLTGSVTFRRFDEKNVAAEGFRKKTTKNAGIKRTIDRILCTAIGIAFILVGTSFLLAMIFLLIDNGEISSISLFPIFVSNYVVGISKIHHGWTKHPIRPIGAFLYGLGVLLSGFFISVLISGINDISSSETEKIGPYFLIFLFILFSVFLIIIGLNFRSDDAGNFYKNTIFMERVPHKLSRDQLRRLIDNIKKRSVTETIKITPVPDKPVEITDSKFGGLPYRDEKTEYPKDENGEYMSFLAQFNLSQLPPNDKLPREGMLQFFINEDMDCKVIYHTHVNMNCTYDDVRAMNIISPYDEVVLPFSGQCGIDFESAEMAINCDDITGNRLIHEAASELGYSDIEDDIELWEIADPEEFPTASYHRLFGYADFTQGDPREPDSKYNTLLFHMDSETEGKFEIMWGDCGVANFFINDEALKNFDFSDVMFEWDCC